MKYLGEKFGDKDLALYGQFAYDIGEGEKLSNKEIARELHKLGFIDGKGLPVFPSIKFLEKVDVNGNEMCDLYRFLKRGTPQLFVPRYGMASRIYDHHTKFLCNRYGEVKKYYTP